MSDSNGETNVLEQLKTLRSNEKILKEIVAYEFIEGKSIPPIFRACIKNLDIWSISEPSMFKVQHSNSSIYLNFGIEEFKLNPEIGIEWLITPSNYKKAKENVYHYEEDQEIIKDKMVIGNIFGGCLLLGIGEHNKDNIYADIITEDIENRAIKIADNILDYFREIKLMPDKESLSRINTNLNQLTKKWGDKFWKAI